MQGNGLRGKSFRCTRLSPILGCKYAYRVLAVRHILRIQGTLQTITHSRCTPHAASSCCVRCLSLSGWIIRLAGDGPIAQQGSTRLELSFSVLWGKYQTLSMLLRLVSSRRVVAGCSILNQLPSSARSLPYKGAGSKSEKEMAVVGRLPMFWGVFPEDYNNHKYQAG